MSAFSSVHTLQFCMISTFEPWIHRGNNNYECATASSQLSKDRRWNLSTGKLNDWLHPQNKNYWGRERGGGGICSEIWRFRELKQHDQDDDDGDNLQMMRSLIKMLQSFVYLQQEPWWSLTMMISSWWEGFDQNVAILGLSCTRAIISVGFAPTSADQTCLMQCTWDKQ